jgi:hypothetical protein
MTRPSPAMVVAVIALVVALSGSAVAATLITRSSQIRNGVITSADLANGRAVDTRDMTPAARRALTGASGRQGAAGPAGPAGPTGATGPAGATGATGTVDTSRFFTKTESDDRFLAKAAAAADSAKLGGLNARGIVIGTRSFNLVNHRGDNSVNRLGFGRRELADDTPDYVDLVGAPGVGFMEVRCLAGPATQVRYTSLSGQVQDVVVDTGNAGATYIPLAPGGEVSSLAVTGANASEMYRLQVGHGGTEGDLPSGAMATFIVTMISSPTGTPVCRAQAQVVNQTIGP